MINEEINAAVKRLVPGAHINLIGGSLEGLMWLDDRPRPTDAEILAEMERQPMIDARAAARQRVDAGYQNALAALIEEYPQAEIDGWGEQVQGARDHQSGTPSPLIDTLADARGITSDEMAARVLTKRGQYLTAYGAATGMLGALRSQIDAAETVDALDAINWPA